MNIHGPFDTDSEHHFLFVYVYKVLELLTNGQDSEVARSWRIPKFTSDELDDYSMVYGYEVPFDILLEDC